MTLEAAQVTRGSCTVLNYIKTLKSIDEQKVVQRQCHFLLQAMHKKKKIHK